MVISYCAGGRHTRVGEDWTLIPYCAGEHPKLIPELHTRNSYPKLIPESRRKTRCPTCRAEVAALELPVRLLAVDAVVAKLAEALDAPEREALHARLEAAEERHRENEGQAEMLRTSIAAERARRVKPRLPAPPLSFARFDLYANAGAAGLLRSSKTVPHPRFAVRS